MKSQRTVNPLRNFAATLLALAFVGAAIAEQPLIVKPKAEGWINSGLNNAARWSISYPDKMGVRNRGTENAWAAYLAFAVPDKASSATEVQLLVTLQELRNKQQFWVYGIEGEGWSPETLMALDAPGWDTTLNDVDTSSVTLLGSVLSDPGDATLTFGADTGEMLQFLQTNAGKPVTLIIVASLGSATLHTSEGSAENGPQLVFEGN